jgi:hypothetical protein
MTPETERERRANQIVRYADRYGSDKDFQKMVDNTVYLTPEETEKSALEVDRVYGTRISELNEIYWNRHHGA